MNILVEIVISLVGMMFGHVSAFLSSLSDGVLLLTSGGGLLLAFASGIVVSHDAVVRHTIPEGVLAAVRRWHGNIDEQFFNIDHLVKTITAHQEWPIASGLLTPLTGNRDQLLTLISKCRSSEGSSTDRELRNTLLKSTVGFCLLDIKIWAYETFSNGMMTAEDVHLLGFLLPGEHGGHHDRTEATEEVAEVKVKVVNEDFIRVVIDQSAGENAAQIVHGWPAGVRNAMIVITSADGKTEVYRQVTPRLHNEIRMPAGSHGKQFIIKAAFLKHVNDEPQFGNEPTFSMPLTTEDLAAALDRQHHEDFEAQLREVERQRQEIERLHAELNARK